MSLSGTAPGLLDLRPIPVNPKCPGVVLHTTFVDNLLTDSFIADAPAPMVILGVIAAALAAAVSLTYGGKWWQAGPLAVVWLAVPIVIGFAAYAKGQWWPVVAQAGAQRWAWSAPGRELLDGGTPEGVHQTGVPPLPQRRGDREDHPRSQASSVWAARNAS